ncbi:LuxR C-terminal-related transcriptional regulator [Actinoplanes subtropicus]|uniref:LuxR C-terminal-related transcriptional regulator n=1 Tax=Actinoplanes subtropicus TaxID=543632 RepID=UPI000AA6D060|nr:LuxR C-terminal-related transcriptional regulator [Actinoplanes subtropicus]
MAPDELLLTHPDPAAPRYVHLATDGARLLRRSWQGAAKPRHSSRDLPNPRAARDALDCEAAARLREGFVFGLSDAEAGKKLHLGEGTVKTHVRHILTKLGCTNRVQAAILAQDAGLTP